MAASHDIVTVGTTATQVSKTETVRSHEAKAQAVLVQAGADDVFLGGPGVTTADYGHKLVAGAALPADLGPTDVLYAVAAAETTVAVLYLGV